MQYFHNINQSIYGFTVASGAFVYNHAMYLALGGLVSLYWRYRHKIHAIVLKKSAAQSTASVDFQEIISQRLWVAHQRGDHFLPKTMTIYRMPSQTLLIHAPVKLDHQALSYLESLGDPEILIVPNASYRDDARFFKENFPDIIIASPKQKCEEVSEADFSCEEYFTRESTAGVTLFFPPLNRFFELHYQVHLNEGTALLVGDSLVNWKPRSFFHQIWAFVKYLGFKNLDHNQTHSSFLTFSRLAYWFGFSNEMSDYVESLTKYNFNTVVFSRGPPMMDETNIAQMWALVLKAL